MAEIRTQTTSTTAIHQRLQTLFNQRDWETLAAHIAPDAVYTDHARQLTVHGPDGVVALYRSWAEAFSEGVIEDGALFDRADDLSISRFVGSGTHDGPLGPIEPTGRYGSTRFCELLRFDDEGRVTSGEVYYDQLGLLAQLGVLPDAES